MKYEVYRLDEYNHFNVFSGYRNGPCIFVNECGEVYEIQPEQLEELVKLSDCDLVYSTSDQKIIRHRMRKFRERISQ